MTQHQVITVRTVPVAWRQTATHLAVHQELAHDPHLDARPQHAAVLRRMLPEAPCDESDSPFAAARAAGERL